MIKALHVYSLSRAYRVAMHGFQAEEWDFELGQIEASFVYVYIYTYTGLDI